MERSALCGLVLHRANFWECSANVGAPRLPRGFERPVLQMNCCPKTFTGCVLLVCVGGASTNGAPIDPRSLLHFSAGPVSIRPQLSAAQVFNDNIYYTDLDKVQDFQTILSPGMKFLVGREQPGFNFASLQYFYDRVQHWEETELSANQHRLALNSFFSKGKFSLQGQDRVDFLSSTIGGGITLTGVKVARTTFFDEYRLTSDLTDRTAVYTELTHRAVDYDDKLALFDSRTIQGTGGFEFQAFSRSRLFGEVYYGQSTSEDNLGKVDAPTAKFVGGFLGVRGDFTEKLTGFLKGGYETRSFDDNSPSGGLPVVQASLQQKLGDRTVVSASYTRSQSVSVQAARSEFVVDSLGLRLSQGFGRADQMKLVVDGSYSNHAYDDIVLIYKDRTDTIYSAGVSMEYMIKDWMTAELGYRLEKFDTTVPLILDYTVNRISLSLLIGY